MTTPTITYGHAFLDDFTTLKGSTSSEATSDGLVTTTIDTARTEGDDCWNGYYIIYTSGTNAGLMRLITDFDAGTDTMTHDAFPNITKDGDTYYLTNWCREAGAPDPDPVFTFATWYDDYLLIGGNSAADTENCYWSYWDEGGAVNLGLSTHTNTTILVRYRTSALNTGLGLNVKAVFSDASTQDIVGTSAAPAYSTQFTTTIVTLTDDKTFDHIRIYAVSEKAANTESIAIDFILVCEGNFSFPQLTGGIEQEFQGKFGRLKLPNRSGDVTQNLGSEDCPFHITGDICQQTAWTGLYLFYGEFIRQIFADQTTDPWQWMTSDIANCKVTLDHATLSQLSTNSDYLHFDMTLYECRVGYGAGQTDGEQYWERWENG